MSPSRIQNVALYPVVLTELAKVLDVLFRACEDNLVHSVLCCVVQPSVRVGEGSFHQTVHTLFAAFNTIILPPGRLSMSRLRSTTSLRASSKLNIPAATAAAALLKVSLEYRAAVIGSFSVSHSKILRALSSEQEAETGSDVGDCLLRCRLETLPHLFSCLSYDGISILEVRTACISCVFNVFHATIIST
jgi:hypothetical protein